MAASRDDGSQEWLKPLDDFSADSEKFEQQLKEKHTASAKRLIPQLKGTRATTEEIRNVIKEQGVEAVNSRDLEKLDKQVNELKAAIQRFPPDGLEKSLDEIKLKLADLSPAVELLKKLVIETAKSINDTAGKRPQQFRERPKFYGWFVTILLVLLSLGIGYYIQPSLHETLYPATQTPGQIPTYTLVPTPLNYPMLPKFSVIDPNIVLTNSDKYQAKWAFLTPKIGIYYFSIKISATNISQYDVMLDRNGDGTQKSLRHEKDDGFWEYYPLTGGEYTTIILYSPDDGFRDNVEFTLLDYQLRAITCMAKVRKTSHWGIFAYAIEGKSIYEPHLYPLFDDSMVYVVGSNDTHTWYRVLYPDSQSGQFNPEGNETTGWILSSELIFNSSTFPDCSLIN